MKRCGVGALEQKEDGRGAMEQAKPVKMAQPFYSVYEYIFSSNLNLVSEFSS